MVWHDAAGSHAGSSPFYHDDLGAVPSLPDCTAGHSGAAVEADGADGTAAHHS